MSNAPDGRDNPRRQGPRRHDGESDLPFGGYPSFESFLLHQPQYWMTPPEPAARLSEHHRAPESTQGHPDFVHLGRAHQNNYHSREPEGIQFGLGDNFQQLLQQQQNRRKQAIIDQTSLREYSHIQRSLYPPMVPLDQTRRSEPSHPGHRDFANNWAPPREPSHLNMVSPHQFFEQDTVRRAPYSDEYRGRDDLQANTHLHERQQTELRHTQQQTSGSFLPPPSQVPSAEMQRDHNAHMRGTAEQNAWESSRATLAQWNGHGPHGHHANIPAPHGLEEAVARHDRREDRFRDAPPAYHDTQSHARGHDALEDQPMTMAARQHSEPESDATVSWDNVDERRKKLAMDFAVESYEKGEIDTQLQCGNPILREAARLLLKEIEAAKAKKAAEATKRAQWRNRPLTKPAQPSFIGAFIDSDEDEDEDVGLMQSDTGFHGLDPGSTKSLENVTSKQETSLSGAAYSKWLREQARHDTPAKATQEDSEMASLFGVSNAAKEQESLFVPETTPKKQNSPNLESTAVLLEEPVGGIRQEDSWTFPQVGRKHMPQALEEEDIDLWPPITQSVEEILPELGELGTSRERAISISSSKSSSSDSSSSDEGEKGNGEVAIKSEGEQRPTFDLMGALGFIQTRTESSPPSQSAMATNAGSPSGSTTQMLQKAETASAIQVNDPLTASTAGRQLSGWQAATAIVQNLPATGNSRQPTTTVSPARFSAKSPETNGTPDENKTGGHEKQQSLESFGEDIMALRAEIARQKQEKREAEDKMEQDALPESEDEGEGPQFDTGLHLTPKRRGRPLSTKNKTIVQKKAVATKPVKKKAPVKQLPADTITSESDGSGEDSLVQNAVNLRGQKSAAFEHDGPISLQKLVEMRKRKATETATLTTKKHKTSPEEKQKGHLYSNGNKHGLPLLESPIRSPEIKAFVKKYRGDRRAMEADAPTCARVLAEEMDLDDDDAKDSKTVSDGLSPPRLKRKTPPPKPVKTNNLRPSSKKGKPWPEAVHIPIEEEDEQDELAPKPARKGPKAVRKTPRKVSNAPNADAYPLEDHDGIIMVNQNFTTPPSNRGAGLGLGDADKMLVKWRNAGLKWADVRTLYANETNRALTGNGLHNRYKRTLEKYPELAAAAVANSSVPPPSDAPVVPSVAEEDAEVAKPGPGGKTWNLDALEAFCANQREINAFLTDGEDDSEVEDDVVVDEKEVRNKKMIKRAPTPEDLDEGECWWMYQVWRKSWVKKAEEPKKNDVDQTMKEEKKKDENSAVKNSEEQTMEKEALSSITLAPEPPEAPAGAERGSHSDSDSDSDESEDSEDEQEDEEQDPEAAAEPYVVGTAYYHCLSAANAAAGQEMRGARFGIGGLGPAVTTGVLRFKFDAGPHGMNRQEVEYADDTVVRVWVDRFARAPGMPLPPSELVLDDDARLLAPNVKRAPHGWLAKTVWVIKRKDLEVRRRTKALSPAGGQEEQPADAMDVDDESKILAISDLATFTVLDAANREAARLALDHMHPPSNTKAKVEARIETKQVFETKLQLCEEKDDTLSIDLEGDDEVVQTDEHGGTIVVKRVDTTFWVESAMLQGPRNV